MITKEHILQRLGDAKPRLERDFPIGRLALFGSWARDEQTDDSDVDILVEMDPSIGLGFVSLADQLERILGRSVDLVSHRAIRPRMWDQIESELIDA